MGGKGAAEISAYDEVSKSFFTVNNSDLMKMMLLMIINPKAEY
jgi:hypothetical protein